MRLPTATYRLQFNASQTIAAVRATLPYLESLGVSDLYASPLSAARAGSNHGYDVVDPRRVNPEIGTLDELRGLGEALRGRGMGLILDLVPNHMCISDPDNVWWQDVLENGPASPYASWFDIDWNPPKSDLRNKVLFPMLGAQYGWAVEQHELVVRLEEQEGAFRLHYGALVMPLAPKSWTHILEPALARLRETRDPEDADVLELESILTAIGHLPSRTDLAPHKLRERQREKRIIKRRLAALLAASPDAHDAVDDSLAGLNGGRDDPAELARLERLLDEQAYRLSFWRVAADEINYRRFFDVNDLAAIRVEDPQVFRAVHELTFQLVRDGVVTGLRIDHVDGLRDPHGYLRQLQRQLGSANGEERFYVVVEKILLGDERLPEAWPVAGTTGYDALGLLDRVLTAPEGEAPLRATWESFARGTPHYDDVSYHSRKLVLRASLSSELTVLSRKLDRISEQHRYTRDFTLNGLLDALREVIACFPVYRTYCRDGEPVSETDRDVIARAIEDALHRNPATNASLFEFIGVLLTLDHPPGLTEAQRQQRRDFVLRTQQLTSAVMAKGTEDTAFYRWYPLASLNEVGGEPDRFQVPLDTFHAANRERLRRAPGGLVATSTHDTKRSEEVRARVRVLSELPAEWSAAVQRWHEWNLPLKTMRRGREMPDRTAEYLFYQTLVGVWPPGNDGSALPDEFVERLQRYMEKALREAKVHTSWVSPFEAYETAAHDFITRTLEARESAGFTQDVARFVARALRPGLWSGLSEVLLKITVPGVPDFYQGTEIWEYRLVDPDNRGRVDFGERQALLRALDEAEQREGPDLLCALAERPEDPRAKLWVTSRALRFRRREATLFQRGTYEPLTPRGVRARHVVCFGRRANDRHVVVAAGRWFARLLESMQPDRIPVGRTVWDDTAIALPREWEGERYRDVLTGRDVAATVEGDVALLPLADVFARLPLALLERIA
ncbi:MAG TPA: malto-oligosyltrehalose synthase [Gemmatimonadaceae bacterium]|nr:malto-oligosyltrehalose synthase [Gemmatimonadaceae bacterium]